ncbi:hypothetical protein AB0E85_05885 [Streptomyces sp. NPDC029044]|uniref:hypothetical protein n=1 Tax=Streptomyces sp. NPDC029044 TaxID=3157198 RepID=UPI0033E0B3EA
MPLLFLNERSWATTCDRRRAGEAMADFIDAVRAVVKEDPDDTALVSEVARESLEIAQGYTIGDWFLDDPKNRDRWRRLRALQNRSPVKSVFPTPDADGHLEYRHLGEKVLGLGAAHFMKGIAVSLAVAPEWTPALIDLERSELVELDDGTLEFEQGSVEVRNISVKTHVDDHLDWIRKTRLARADSGRQIWERRADLYPHLEFLPAVEAQLSDLNPHWIVPVRQRLEQLNTATAAWDTKNRPEPEWPAKVTPEGENRKRACQFKDLDGETRTFDLHARFTPGAGRIHFRLIRQEKGKLRIAHIGDKIPAGRPAPQNSVS